MSARPLRLLIVEAGMAVTGAFISAREMARTLRGEAEVSIMLPATTKIADRDLADFSNVYRAPIIPVRKKIGAIIAYLPSLIRTAFKLKANLNRERFDGLLINDFHLLHGAAVRLIGYHGPILTWVRMDPAAFGSIGQMLLCIAAQASDKTVVVSRYLERVTPDHIRTFLLYDPVSTEFLSDPPSTPPEHFKFVFTGNYIQGKGQDLAIEAFARLLPAFPLARLDFYGGDMGMEKNKAYRQRLEKRAEELGIGEAVSFHGFATDPRAVLDGAYAALMLSHSESFSRTTLEACASALPVIATRCGGPEEIIEDGRTGILIPVGDAEACADAMRALCENPGAAAVMGAKGRERVLREFSPEAFNRNFWTLMRDIKNR